MTFILGCNSHGMYNKLHSIYYRKGDRRCCDHIVVGFIATKVVSLNPVYGEVYSIQYYVIMFVSNLRQVSSFLRVLYFPLPIKLTATIHSWNIVESGVKHHKSTKPINYRKQISLMNMIYVASQNPI
jgi:hypothetical protein